MTKNRPHPQAKVGSLPNLVGASVREILSKHGISIAPSGRLLVLRAKNPIRNIQWASAAVRCLHGRPGRQRDPQGHFDLAKSHLSEPPAARRTAERGTGIASNTAPLAGAFLCPGACVRSPRWCERTCQSRPPTS
jgi:hypothetical protein